MNSNLFMSVSPVLTCFEHDFWLGDLLKHTQEIYKIPGGGPAARGRARLPPPGRRLVFCIYFLYIFYIFLYILYMKYHKMAIVYDKPQLLWLTQLTRNEQFSFDILTLRWFSASCTPDDTCIHQLWSWVVFGGREHEMWWLSSLLRCWIPGAYFNQ